MLYKIWDDKFKHYCLTVYSKEQAEIMVAHFTETDFAYGENIKDRYRIDEVVS
jgi:hypothetical protein